VAGILGRLIQKRLFLIAKSASESGFAFVNKHNVVLLAMDTKNTSSCLALIAQIGWFATH
jgi:hypothetical protein